MGFVKHNEDDREIINERDYIYDKPEYVFGNQPLMKNETVVIKKAAAIMTGHPVPGRVTAKQPEYRVKRKIVPEPSPFADCIEENSGNRISISHNSAEGSVEATFAYEPTEELKTILAENGWVRNGKQKTWNNRYHYTNREFILKLSEELSKKAADLTANSMDFVPLMGQKPCYTEYGR